MKINHRRLNAFIKMFGIENIYQFDCNRFGCTIFAYKTKEVESWLQSHKFIKKDNEGWNINKWVRGNYTVILS